MAYAVTFPPSTGSPRTSQWLSICSRPCASRCATRSLRRRPPPGVRSDPAVDVVGDERPEAAPEVSECARSSPFHAPPAAALGLARAAQPGGGQGGKEQDEADAQR